MVLADVIFDEVCPGCNEIISDQEALEAHVDAGHWGKEMEVVEWLSKP